VFVVGWGMDTAVQIAGQLHCQELGNMQWAVKVSTAKVRGCGNMNTASLVQNLTSCTRLLSNY
jgi:hypothetical protein